MNHYGSDIHEWEVVNEVQHSTTIFRAVHVESDDV